MTRLWISIGLLIFVLAGCGGGGEDGSPALNAGDPTTPPGTCSFNVADFLNGSTRGKATSVWRCTTDRPTEGGQSLDFVAFADGTGVSSAIGEVTWAEASCGNIAIQGSVPQVLSEITLSSDGGQASFVAIQSVGSVGATCTRAVSAPEPRRGHSAVYDSLRQRMVVFGGSVKFGNLGVSRSLSDTWEFDGTSWRQVHTSDVPDSFLGHNMVYDKDRGRVVLLIGQTGLPDSATWEFDGTGWTRVSTTVAPSSRGYHAMAYDSIRRVTVLFGGSPRATGAGNTLFDTWEYDGENWSFKSSSDRPCLINNPPSPFVPCAAYESGMTFDPVRGVTVLAGRDERTLETGMWTWDGSLWTEKAPVTHPGGPSVPAFAFDSRRGRAVFVMPQIWEWDGSEWLSTGVGLNRLDATAVYDEAYGVTLIFGGSGETLLNDVLRWDGVSLTQ